MQVADSTPNCGIAIGIELGDPLTVHPKNKQEVGRRLALVALEKVYGSRIESSGPRYESSKIEGTSIRVKFSHAEGLMCKGAELQRFAIAGKDRHFNWAEAKIEGDTVVISSPTVGAPVAVRMHAPTIRRGVISTTVPACPHPPFARTIGHNTSGSILRAFSEPLFHHS